MENLEQQSLQSSDGRNTCLLIAKKFEQTIEFLEPQRHNFYFCSIVSGANFVTVVSGSFLSNESGQRQLERAVGDCFEELKIKMRN